MCVSVCWFLFCFFVRLSEFDNACVCSGPAELCGDLNLDLMRTMEHCWTEGGGRGLWESAGFSLTPSPLCGKENKIVAVLSKKA